MCSLCRCELDPGASGRTATAQAAHIRALSDRGPRASADMSTADRNAVSNLMYLCPTCHDKIDKAGGAEAFTTEDLLKIKRDHETLMAVMRQSAQPWSMSYSNIDYVNMPRVAMLLSGHAVLQVAQRAGLDPQKPFRQQGAAPGFFVGELRPAFEAWRERAVPLDAARLADIRPGMYVTFDAFVRSHNTLSGTLQQRPDGSWSGNPTLSFPLDGRAITIRYDPAWLTTSTATNDLVTAESEPARYAGFGLVVSVSEKNVRVSAHVFGRPQTSFGAYMKYTMHSKGTMTQHLDTDDFPVNASTSPSTSHGLPSGTSSRGNGTVSAALHFDEDSLVPGQLERETFRQLMRVVPEIRRDITIGVQSLATSTLTSHGMSPIDLAAELLGGSPKVWSSHSIDAWGTMLRTKEMAFACVRGIRQGDLTDLHHELLSHSDSYLGALQVRTERPLHKFLYGEPPGFRIAGADLRLLYSAREYSEEYGIEDQRDHDRLSEWEDAEGFRSVSWEEDEEQSAEDLRQAESGMAEFFGL
ncbi:HNH endonuclease signature motif containing protein [Streptomyces phaeochromogenes]